MPQTLRITKPMIVYTFFELVRERGAENLSAENIAERLGSSVQPVYYNFKTFDHLRRAAYHLAADFYLSAVLPQETERNPLIAIGMNHMRFVERERNLFQFLFHTHQYGTMNMAEMMDAPGVIAIIEAIEKGLGCSPDEAHDIFLMFFCEAHGLANLIANQSLEYDEEQCRKMLENVFYGMITWRGFCSSKKETGAAEGVQALTPSEDIGSSAF